MITPNILTHPMRTIEYLSGPSASLFWPAIIAGVAIALTCGLLSVFVVLRRLAFIGHGVSHAAFGGVGLAAVLGLTGGTAAATTGYLVVVGGFCITAAILIAYISARAKLREDTVIGVALVASMSLGALLLHRASAGGNASLEGNLFGSIWNVGPADAAAAWIVAIVIGALVIIARRPLLFWAFEESAALAFGVNTMRMRLLLMALLGVAIVVAMKLAGVILATALLILPGAAALRLSSRLGPVFAISIASALLGILGGLILSFEMDWPPGPSVVTVLVGVLIMAWPLRLITRRAAISAASAA